MNKPLHCRFHNVWLALLPAAVLVFSLAGCRAPLIDAAIVNQGSTVRLLEFDYPDASFGADALAAGAQLHHGFAVKGSGAVTLHFVDGDGKNHTVQGPTVRDGDNGSLLVTIGPTGAVQWNLKLSGQQK